MDDTIKQNLDKLQTSLIKQFGKGTIFQGKNNAILQCEMWDIESPELANLLGGGLAKGRVMEVFGPESGGKCIYENTYIATKYGYKTVREIFKQNNGE